MRFRRALPVLLLLLCAACVGPLDVTFTLPAMPQPPTPAPVYEQYARRFGSGCQPSMLVELQVEGAGPVSALSFDDAGRQLLVVHASTERAPGALRRWEMPEGNPGRVDPLGPVAVAGAAFDASGRVLATVGTSSEGVAVWDASRGEAVRRLLPELSLDATSISADGRFVLSAKSSSGLFLNSLDPSDREHNIGLGLFTETGVEIVNRVALDGEGRFWAYATTEGRVELFEPGERQVAIGWGSGAPVLDLEFDAARQRLALLREDSLTVKNLGMPLHLGEARVPLEPMQHGAIAFSSSGRLLALAFDKGWQLCEVRNLKVLSEDSSVAATAVAFSRDECLLAVGDDRGVVRVYSCSDGE